ncbi:MAG: class I adenylate-forming enzyme family protein [Janthinobacterium lividum]
MAETVALEALLRRMHGHGDARAIVEGDRVHRYADLIAGVADWQRAVVRHGIGGGDVVAIRSDFSFSAITLALALFRTGCIVAFVSPTAPDVAGRLAEVGAIGLFDAVDGALAFSPGAPPRQHALLETLRKSGDAGFVIFTSGASGRPKAVLHHLGRFLGGYRRADKALVTLAFLLFDHVAGLDTMFYTLHAGGCLVLTPTRIPRAVAALVARWRIEVLPTSPSFLKLMCLSGAAEDHDLRSLRIVTFGSEPMPRSTLDQIAALLPDARLRQKYGASEFGAPRVETRGDDGLWIRLASDDTEIRVIDGVLWIRASTTMLGYLNADNPVQADGWLCTGDRVESDGDWLRVLGRDTDLINVGGEKVYPSEVEAVVAELDGVAQVAATGSRHPLLGQVVAITVQPRDADADPAQLRRQIRAHCQARLQRHAVPATIAFSLVSLVNERHKMMRTALERP